LSLISVSLFDLNIVRVKSFCSFGRDVVSIPLHAVRAYIVSHDIAINQFYPTWHVVIDNPTITHIHISVMEFQ